LEISREELYRRLRKHAVAPDRELFDEVNEIFASIDPLNLILVDATKLEFAEFYDAMNSEYERHRPRKGDSWKDDVAIAGRMWPTHADYSEESPGIPVTKSMEKYLYELLETAFKEYLETRGTASACRHLACLRYDLDEERQMTSVKRRYRIIHVHYYEGLNTVLLCLDPLDKLPRGPMMIPAGTDDERVVGHMVQATIKAMEGVIPPQYREDKTLKIEITLEDYEKLESPGILDEVLLTLDAKGEMT